MSEPIGCGEWSAQVAGRGGSPVRSELAWTSISKTHLLNESSSASVSVPYEGGAGIACCEAMEDAEPWRDEILLYRGRTLVHAGPLITARSAAGGGQLDSNDLFAWMDVRFLEEDFIGDGDAADVFQAVFEAAYSKDRTPNISTQMRRTGVPTFRSLKGVEFHRAADLLRELARTALDFTMVGRTLLAGGIEIFSDQSALRLHDDGVLELEVVREGSQFATDLAVFSGTTEVNGSPITGRATRAVTHFGLIQRSATELLIKDRPSADANALARLEAMQPAPLRVSVTLSPEAGFTYEELIPGRRVDCRLSKEIGCVPAMQIMRLNTITTNVSRSEAGMTESVSLDLVPIGLAEDAG